MKNLPNLISSFRLLVAFYLIYLGWLGWTNDKLTAILAWTVIAYVSDVFDGRLARRLGCKSRLGAFLDPLADKLLTAVLLVLLVLRYLPAAKIDSMFKLWLQSLVLVVVLLEAFIAANGIYGCLKGLDVSANKCGKLKVLFESATIVIWLISLLAEHHWEVKNAFSISVYMVMAVLLGAAALAIGSIDAYWRRFQHIS